MSEHICEFCGSSFKKSCNLITHKKTAKYCLEIQGKNNKSFKCKKCGKCFNYNQNLVKHEKICKSDNVEKAKLIESFEEKIRKLEIDNKEKDGLVETLEKKIRQLEMDSKEKIHQLEMDGKEKEELADREIVRLKGIISDLETKVSEYKLKLAEDKGKITVYKEIPPGTVYVNPKILNVKCDTISPLTIDTVKKSVDAGDYSYELYIRGEKGLVDFISNIILTDDEQRSYVCTDASRNRFHRLIETREWKDDNGAKFLNKIFDQLKAPALEYYDKINNMTRVPDERDTGEFLMDKTKKMFFGIYKPNSSDRSILFAKIRNEVRNLASI